MKNTDDFVVKESHYVPPPNKHFCCQQINGIQRGTLVSPLRMHVLYMCVLRYAKKIVKKSSPYSLAIVELHWSEGIRQLVNQLVENSVKYFLNSVVTC